MNKPYKLYTPSRWEKRIDAVIKAFSPVRAERRAISRERMNYFRYLAAQATTARENATPTTSGEWFRGSLEKQQVMWNAINCVDNSGLCSGIVLKFQTYVCGTLRWQARTGDKDVNKVYEDYIAEKTKARNLDIVGRDSLRQMCMLDVKGMIVKGDIGTNVVRGENDELYLQGIEGDRIGNPYRYQTNDRYVRGLVLDEVGQIVAVKVFHRNRMSGLYEFDNTFPMNDEHGLPSFLFMVNPLSYDDKRGVSVFKSAIDNATYIARMREYELQALLWAASQSGVYYTKSGMLPEGLPFDKPAMLMDSSGNQLNTYQARPNTIIALGSDGEKVEMFQHDRPSPNVIGMYNNTVRDIAVGTGLSYAFAYDMSGLTGPSVRMCSWQDTRAIEIWQQILREQKLDPVVMLLLGNAIAKGEVPYHENWLQWQWFFPPKPTIDAGYDSQASLAEIEAGVQSASSVAMMRGEDIDDIQAQRAQEIEDAINRAKEVADRVDAPWQQVYALMRPPPRGALGPAGQTIGPGMMPEPGATSDGVSLDSGEQPSKQQQRRERESITLRLEHSVANKNGERHEFYSPDQPRDDHGRWTDGGGGGLLTGIDKRLVDYKPDRSLSDPTKTESINKATGTRMMFTPYSQTPFFDHVNRMQGTPDPDKVSIDDYVKARDELFNKQPVTNVPLDGKVFATQQMVNKERVAELAQHPELGGTKPILAVREGGDTYILNGHHRVAAEIQRGGGTMPARVLDLDAQKDALHSGLIKWQDLVTHKHDIAVANTPDIASIRQAATEEMAGDQPKGFHADYARAMLAHAEPQDKRLIRGTASGYWVSPKLRGEPGYSEAGEQAAMLSHFPVGETMNLNMLSFTPDDTMGEDNARKFGRWAVDRHGGEPVFLRLERGANAIDTTKHIDDLYDPPEARVAEKEREHIVADKAKITSAYHRADGYYVHLKPLRE